MAKGNKFHTLFNWEITLPYAASVAVTAVYIVGFLVLNAHLSKHGIFDLELANWRYVIAGVHFVVFLLFWGGIAGLATIGQEQMASAEIKFMANRGLGPAWHVVIVIKSFVRILSGTCISAFLYSLMVLGDHKETLRSIDYLLPIFAILILVTFVCRKSKFPRLYQVTNLVATMAPIHVFFKMISVESMTMIVFVLFLTMSLAAKLIFYLFMLESKMYTTKIFIPIFSLVLFSVSFGLLQYYQIPTAFGGGQSHIVEIMIGDEKVLSVLTDTGCEVTPFLKAKLIYQPVAKSGFLGFMFFSNAGVEMA